MTLVTEIVSADFAGESVVSRGNDSEEEDDGGGEESTPAELGITEVTSSVVLAKRRGKHRLKSFNASNFTTAYDYPHRLEDLAKYINQSKFPLAFRQFLYEH